MHLAVLERGHSKLSLKHPRKIIVIRNAAFNGYCTDGKVSLGQKLDSKIHTFLCDIFGEGLSQLFLEQRGQIRWVDAELSCQVF